MSEQPTDRPLSTVDLVDAGSQAGARLETRQQPNNGGTQQPVENRTMTPTENRPASPAENQPMPLLNNDATEKFRTRWTSVQTGFVDEPRTAVQQADTLVAEVMKQIAETFATERSRLEAQWSQGENVSTEDLRVALQRYRSFFNRLLTL